MAISLISASYNDDYGRDYTRPQLLCARCSAVGWVNEGTVLGLLSAGGTGVLLPSSAADKGTLVRHRIAEAGAILPAQAWTGRRTVLPSPAGREWGNALKGAPRCAPTPLSPRVGEGLGVRAKKRARPAHSELKRCTLISSSAAPLPLRRREEPRFGVLMR